MCRHLQFMSCACAALACRVENVRKWLDVAVSQRRQVESSSMEERRMEREREKERERGGGEGMKEGG